MSNYSNKVSYKEKTKYIILFITQFNMLYDWNCSAWAAFLNWKFMETVFIYLLQFYLLYIYYSF